MISQRHDVRVLVATQPIDFRAGINRLVSLVTQALGSDAYGGILADSWRIVPEVIETLHVTLAGSRNVKNLLIRTTSLGRFNTVGCSYRLRLTNTVRRRRLSGDFGELAIDLLGARLGPIGWEQIVYVLAVGTATNCGRMSVR